MNAAAAAEAPLFGREAEARLVVSAISSGRHVLIEGPHGAGKSRLIVEVCRRLQCDPVTVSGSVGATYGQLVGHHDPSLVVKRGYQVDTFDRGPLLRAMAQGRPLHLDEANRLSPEIVSALVGAMSEGSVTIPRFGTVAAVPGFTVIASVNSDDLVGTQPLPQAFLDRVVRVGVTYQPRGDEAAIVESACPAADPWIRARAVDVTRASRHHPELSRGASVRGAIDLAAISMCLDRLLPRTPGSDHAAATSLRNFDIGLQSAYLALSSKLTPRLDSGRTIEMIIRDLWSDVVITASRARGSTANAVIDSAPSALAAAPIDDGLAETGDNQTHDAASHDTNEAQGATSASGLMPSGATRNRNGSRYAGTETPEPVRVTEQAMREFIRETGTADRIRLQRRDLDGLDVEQVERVAAHIVIRRLREHRAVTASSGGPLSTVRYNFRSDDIDVDRTLESLVEQPVLSHRDIWVRDRTPRQRGVALIVDVSGSMRGERLIDVATAAAAAGLALAGEELTVVAFADNAEVVRRSSEHIPAVELVRRILALRPIGLTDLARGLDAAHLELMQMRAQRQLAVVMTDGVGNLGTDPVLSARAFDRLNVLATTSSPWRLNQCRELASAGSGVCETYNDLDHLPAVLTSLLTP